MTVYNIHFCCKQCLQSNALHFLTEYKSRYMEYIKSFNLADSISQFLNFPFRSRCVLNGILHRKNSGFFYVTWESFFYKNSLVKMFQSMSAPVHCCPKSHKWIPEWTLNKKSQDCSECCNQLKSRLPVIWNYNRFPAKTCLCSLGQYCTCSFLVQCCLRRVDTALYRLFSS